MSSLLATVLVGVLALASAAGATLLAAGVIVVQLVFALGAVRAVPIPSARWAAWLAVAGGATAVVWLVWAATPRLNPLAAVLGLTVVGAILGQLWRRNGRVDLVASLTTTGTASALAVLSAAWVGLRQADGGLYTVGLGLLGVGVATLSDAVPLPATVRRILAVLVAGAAATGLALGFPEIAAEVPAVSAVAVAAFGALVAVTALAAVDRVDADIRSGGRAGDTGLTSPLRQLRIALPIMAAAPVVYALGRILVG